MNSVDYWRDREEKNREKHIKEEKEYEKELENIYSRELDAIENRIYSFYSRYATVEGITIAEARKRVSNHDVKEFSETAKRYVKEKNFSERANEELRLYNLTMRVNYQELLKCQIALETCASADELEAFMKEKLEGRTIEEIERQAGILGESLLDQTESVKSVVNASFHNATFSDRVWANQSILRSNLENILTNAMIQGRNPRDYISQIRKTCNVSRYQAERLLRTELSRVQADAQMKCYKEADFDEYIYHALGSGACDECKALDKQHFKLKDAEIGVNMFPMHPNCRCSTGPYMDTEDFDEWLNSIDEHGLTWEEWKISKVNEKGNSYRIGDNSVDLNYIKSSEFRKKFSKLTNNSKVNDAIRKYATSSLIHRKGTDGEDAFIINAQTGELLLRNVKSNSTLEASFDAEDINELRIKYSGVMIGLHNHPTNIPPTGSDLVAAGYRRYDFAVIVTHDGKVFKYAPGDKPFLPSLFDKRIEKYQKNEYNLSEYEAHLKVLDEFREEYGIKWKEIES